MNESLTPTEATDSVFHQIDSLLALGVCESCAIRLMCAQHGLDYRRLLVLWLDRDHGDPN